MLAGWICWFPLSGTTAGLNLQVFALPVLLKDLPSTPQKYSAISKCFESHSLCWYVEKEFLGNFRQTAMLEFCIALMTVEKLSGTSCEVLLLSDIWVMLIESHPSTVLYS